MLENNHPKVSIVVPIYNTEKYLKECLDSIVNQTLKDIEIICVNDGSTDGSLAIIEEYASRDSRVKIINKKNAGYGHTVNLGIKNATADYVGIVESDDFVKPEMFSDLYNLITEYNCDFVKSDYYLYYSSKNKIEPNNMIKAEDSFKLTNARKNPDLLFLIQSVWSCVYKKDFLIKNNIWFLETPGASFQDNSFHAKVFMSADKIVLVNKPYVFYRQDNESSSINNKSKVYCMVDEYREVFSYLDSHPDLEFFRQYIYEMQFIAYQWNLTRISYEFMQEFFDVFYKEFKNYYDKNLLDQTFFDRIEKRGKFNLFINYPEKYLRRIIKQKKFKKWKELRRKIIKIRINRKNKEIKIKLFGRVFNYKW